jgi:hypothetical protein
MLKHLEEKPDILGPFEKGDLFYALCDHKGSYAYASLNFTYGDVVILHLEFERFSHNILKMGVTGDWKLLTDECKKQIYKIYKLLRV